MRLTILRDAPSPADPQALALSALAWVLSDGPRAERFLALTGLTPEDLRLALGDPAQSPTMLGAVLDFLGSHEPDLIAAAEHLGVAPGSLIAARDNL